MGNLKIGWGRKEISTEEPVLLIGQMYMRVSQGILDPLYATAMVVDGGEGQDVLAFCSIDMGSLRGNISEEISEGVHARIPQIPKDAIMLNVTHTHSGGPNSPTAETTPDGMPIFSGQKYRALVIRQCIEAICEAWENRIPSGMAYGYGYAVAAHSRRVIYHDDTSLRMPNSVAPNGHGVMYGKTRDDQFSHYEAGADHFLNLMFTFDEAEKLTGIVVNVPCPSQLSEHFLKMSSDFWNEVRELVAKEYGEDVYVLTHCAAAGDLSPRILHYNEAQSRRFRLKYGVEAAPYDFDARTEASINKIMCERRDIAERILEGIREVYSWAKKDIQTDVPVRHERRDLMIDRRLITDEEKAWCEDTLRVMEANLPDENSGTPQQIREAVSFYNSIKGRNERTLERYEEQKTEKQLPIAIHTVRIGDIAFATNRFELYMDYMHRIQARSPFIQTFVVQLCGDEGGTYLSTERGSANKGYSASLFCNQYSYEGGQQLVEATLEMLNELAD